MDDWQSAGVLLAVIVVAFGALYLVLHALRGKPVAKPVIRERCDTCVHFDREEGQAVMQKHPLAMAAYSVISPNDAMTKRDKNGDVIPLENPLSAKDDNFNSLGACMANEELRLGCDKCPKWQARA